MQHNTRKHIAIALTFVLQPPQVLRIEEEVTDAERAQIKLMSMLNTTLYFLLFLFLFLLLFNNIFNLTI
jgi:hypothetical protein